MSHNRTGRPVSEGTPIAVLMLVLAFVAAPLAAQVDDDAADPAALPDPGPPPEEAPIPPKRQDSGSRAAPTVTITTEEDGQITEEYRLNGSVYMVKVTPKNGIAYYLFDGDGDGSLETKWTEVQGVVKPVYYKIKEWK